MSLAVTDLLTLDPNEVEQFRAAMVTMLQEYNPNIDLKRGPTQDLVVTPKAALDTATQANIDRIRQSSSLLQIQANPTLADTGVVDNLLSNYGLTRQAAAAASGPVTIVLSAMTATIIPTSLTFTINSRTYAPDQTYAGRTSSGSVSGPGDRLIVQVGSNYVFTINVIDRATGAAGNASMGNAAVPSAAITSFIRAYVQADFTGGADAETNAELLANLQAGLAAKTWSNRATIAGMLQQQFPQILAVSITGFGDPEMLRDQHQIWPGSCGGRADLYVRTSEQWQIVSLTKTATLVSKIGSVGTWQFTVSRDNAPGYYVVDRVLLPTQDVTSTGFAASLDTRALDLTPDATHAYFPDLVNVIEGVYTRYQAATVQFVDTITNASSLTPNVSTASYTVLLRIQPNIADIQDWIGDRTRQPPNGDALVKAAVPCFTTVGFTLTVLTGTTVSSAAVAAAVAAVVNEAGFAGSVAASTISAAVHTLLGAAVVSLTAFSLAGQVHRPDGTIISLSSSTAITAPDDPANGLSSRTIVFFLEPTDVTVTIVYVAAPTS